MTRPSEIMRRAMPDYDAIYNPIGRVTVPEAEMPQFAAVARSESERLKLKWQHWVVQLEAAERQHPELFSADTDNEEQRQHESGTTKELPEFPEIWRQVFPFLDEVYLPSLPMDWNIGLLLKKSEDLHKRQHQDRRAVAAAQAQTEARAQLGSFKSIRHPNIDEIQDALRKPTSDPQQSPIQALQQQVKNVFMHGPLRAGGIFANLSAAAESGQTKVLTPSSGLPVPWNSCKATATLVGLLACPQERLYEVLKFQSQRLAGLPTLDMIRTTPTSSLQTAFRNAKALARGEKGISTVIVVSLIDVHIFELARQGKSEPYTSYAHTFILGIGPEGVAIWQGWGEHGYGLDEWISDGGSRTRSWQEAGDFVDVFERFAAYEGRWDAKRNKLYKKCFDVDVWQICGAKGPSRPIVPKVQSWVRLLIMEDVTVDDVYKSTYE